MFDPPLIEFKTKSPFYLLCVHRQMVGWMSAPQPNLEAFLSGAFGFPIGDANVQVITDEIVSALFPAAAPKRKRDQDHDATCHAGATKKQKSSPHDVATIDVSHVARSAISSTISNDVGNDVGGASIVSHADQSGEGVPAKNQTVIEPKRTCGVQ